MEGIKEKKRALGLINTTNYSSNKRIDNNKKNLSEGKLKNKKKTIKEKSANIKS